VKKGVEKYYMQTETTEGKITLDDTQRMMDPMKDQVFN
jgi:hypothetical protein